MNVEYLEKYYKSKLEDVFFSEKSLTYLPLFEDKIVKFHVSSYVFLRTVNCFKTGVNGRFCVIKQNHKTAYIDLFIPNFLKKRILGKHYYKHYGRMSKHGRKK